MSLKKPEQTEIKQSATKLRRKQYGNNILTYDGRNNSQKWLINVAPPREAIIIIPGILGSELFAGQDYGCFKEGMPLISTAMIKCFKETSPFTAAFESWKLQNAQYLTNTSVSITEYADCLYEFLKCNNDGTSNKLVSVKKIQTICIGITNVLEYTRFLWYE